MSKVVIIGGHGKVALKLARLLSPAHEVTSWIRNPDHEADVTATGAQAQVHDVESMSVLEMTQAYGDTDVVIWSAGAGGGSPERTYAVDRDAAIRSIDAAVADAHRPRYIMVSYFGAGPSHGVPQDNSFYAYAESKAAADVHLTGSTLPWVILGPSSLTDDPGTGQIEIAPGVEATQVSRDDVAAVAAYVVDHPQLQSRFIQFNNGSESIDSVLT